MHAIDLTPLWNVAGGYLVLLVAGVATMGAKKLLGLLHITLTDKQWAVFHRTGVAAAERLWAESRGDLPMSISVSNPLIAKAAIGAIQDIPLILNGLGLSPVAAANEMQKSIASHLGTKVDPPAAGGAK